MWASHALAGADSACQLVALSMTPSRFRGIFLAVRRYRDTTSRVLHFPADDAANSLIVLCNALPSLGRVPPLGASRIYEPSRCPASFSRRRCHDARPHIYLSFTISRHTHDAIALALLATFRAIGYRLGEDGNDDGRTPDECTRTKMIKIGHGRIPRVDA